MTPKKTDLSPDFCTLDEDQLNDVHHHEVHFVAHLIKVMNFYFEIWVKI
jgi:hypothetical protein